MNQSAPSEPGAPDSRRGAVIGLIVVVVLLVGGLLLVRVLQHMSRVQDCVLSGRSNCAPIEVPSGGN